jgi:Flp pilus assembly protein TadG
MLGAKIGLGRKLLRRYVKSERGATAVEFAFVGGPFLYMLGVIIEAGSMLFTQFALQNAVQDTARTIRTGQVQACGLSSSGFKTKMCTAAGYLPQCASKALVNVQTASNFSNLKATMVNPLTVGFNPDGTAPPLSWAPGTAQTAQGVVVTMDWSFHLPWMSMLANTGDTTKRRLVGMAIFRNEPFPSGAPCPP